MSKLRIIDLNKQLIVNSKEAVSKMETLQNSVQSHMATLKRIEAELLKIVRAEAEEKRLKQQQEEAEQTRAAEQAKAAEEALRQQAEAEKQKAKAAAASETVEEEKKTKKPKQAEKQEPAAAVGEPVAEVSANSVKEDKKAEAQKQEPAAPVQGWQPFQTQKQWQQPQGQQRPPRSDRTGYDPQSRPQGAGRGPRPQGQDQRPQGQRPYGQDQRPQGQDQRPFGQGRPQGQDQRPFGQGRPQGQGQRPPMRPGQHPQGRPLGKDEAAADIRSSGFVQVDKKNTAGKKHREDTHKWDDKSKGSRRALMKDQSPFDGSDERYRGKKRSKTKTSYVPIAPIVIDKAVMNMETISVKSLAEKTGKPVAELLKKLMMLGMMSTINSELDYDTAQLICSEFGINLELKLDKTAEDVLGEGDMADEDKDLKPRPPIVTVMGHVDHGKTSLLDVIRKTRVTEHEAGGITQHIGAYTINHKDQDITFLDTPGHEAFTAMRARGAQVTDIAILVVAADDGVMPQTVEAINHAKAAKVPIIVAINKIDRPNANPNKVMQELTEHGLVAEDWGGDTVMVPVSAITKEGIDQLLEMILLLSEVQELKANPNRLAKGTIVEAKLDKGRGPVATVLVQNGTLRVSDMIVAGTAYGKVRAMVDDMGNRVEEALPSQPVEVVGFSEVPVAGDVMHAVEQDKLTKQVAEERKDKQKADMLKNLSKVSLDDLFSRVEEGLQDLNIIIKADVQGSVEAVKQALEKLSNKDVRVNVIHAGVGAIKAMDVMLATSSNAIIIGFNVRPDSMARVEAEKEKVEIRTYRVIYKAIEDIQLAMKGMLAPEFKEVVLGHAEVRTIFNVSAIGTIAGSYVTDGKIVRSASVRLLRDDVVVFEGSIAALKRFKDDAKEVNQGYECGITLKNYNDIKEGDIIESYEMQEIER